MMQSEVRILGETGKSKDTIIGCSLCCDVQIFPSGFRFPICSIGGPIEIIPD